MDCKCGANAPRDCFVEEDGTGLAGFWVWNVRVWGHRKNLLVSFLLSSWLSSQHSFEFNDRLEIAAGLLYWRLFAFFNSSAAFWR